MNTIGRLLKLPWLATVKPSGWWLLPLLMWGTWTLILGNSGGNQHHVPWRHWALIALVLAVATIWSFVSNIINLLRDAQGLRVPQARHEAIRCLVAYALLTVAVPGVLLGAVFGHTLMLATLLAMAASAGVLWKVVPAWLLIALMIPAFGIFIMIMRGRMDLDLSNLPAFFAWSIPLTLLCVLVSAKRWHALQRADTSNLSRLQAPGVVNMHKVRLNRLEGYASAAASPVYKSSKSQPSHLRNVGPEFPVRSLRVALHARIRPWGLVDKGRHGLSAQQVIAVVVLAIALLVFLIDRWFGRDALLQFTPMGLMVVGIVMAGYAKMFWRHLDASSHGHGSGTALLALLPNLGSPVQVKRRALLAWLTPDIHGTLGIGLVAAVICLLLRAPPMCYLYLALMAAGGVATCAALMANTLGGIPLRPWATYVFYPIGVVLASLTAFWGVQGADSKPVSLHTPWPPAAVCIALWLAWLAAMAILALCGWRALQRRPHPFFTNAS